MNNFNTIKCSFSFHITNINCVLLFLVKINNITICYNKTKKCKLNVLNFKENLFFLDSILNSQYIQININTSNSMVDVI